MQVPVRLWAARGSQAVHSGVWTLLAVAAGVFLASLQAKGTEGGNNPVRAFTGLPLESSEG